MNTSRYALVRKFKAKLFKYLCLSAVLISVSILIFLLYDIVSRGIGSINPQFLDSFPSRFPQKAGIKSALYGTIWLIGLTAFFCIPISIGAAIYLEEYSKKNFLSRFIHVNIVNLSSVPAIIYGMLGLTIFTRLFMLGQSILAGALTMALLVMPMVIVASRESIKAVPHSLREASYAMGATKWQTTRRVVIPHAFSGMMTGSILALSRAIGEAAPLIMIGALTFIAFVPDGPMSEFTVLSIQIFNWISRPQTGFHSIAAGAIIVLLIILFILNGTATFLRMRFQANKYGRE